MRQHELNFQARTRGSCSALLNGEYLLMKKRLTAIDLYSGVGGWSLGLGLAGIDVIASYEWWAPANLSNEVNNSHRTFLADIRNLAREGGAKQKVDIVVGSPPCTQFSFANRGGNGDIADGFLDLAAFFEIVKQCSPKWWAMENVPRIAELLPEAVQRGRPLYKYRDLIADSTIEVVNCADFGVPQARKRCIVGNFDFKIFRSYRNSSPRRTLGNVISALAKKTVVDPIYGIRLPNSQLTDHVKEACLSKEEERLNREAKAFHPVYNTMSFPEKMRQPARTITATCTRVSRESLIVPDEESGGFRRLTIRERGCLQGFPINYQFMGSTSAEKMKMVGNAIPPLLTFMIGEAIQRQATPRLDRLSAANELNRLQVLAPVAPAELRVGQYKANRNFRLALPSLRFKSGMRFELSNARLQENGAWDVHFYFGSSKDVRSVRPTSHTIEVFTKSVPPQVAQRLVVARDQGIQLASRTDSSNLQRVWTNESLGVHPFEVVDQLGEIARAAIDDIRLLVRGPLELESLHYALSDVVGGLPLSSKMAANAAEISVGMAVASGFNAVREGRKSVA